MRKNKQGRILNFIKPVVLMLLINVLQNKLLFLSIWNFVDIF